MHAVLVSCSRWTQPISVIERNPIHDICQKFDPLGPNPTHGWTQPMSISAMKVTETV